MHFSRQSAMPAASIEAHHRIPQPLPYPLKPFRNLQRERGAYISKYSSVTSLNPDQRPSLKRRDTGSTTGDKTYANCAFTDWYV